MLCVTQVFAQDRTITGTVTAKDDGLPVPGASVKIKGTSIGTQTNVSGKYTLRVSSGQTLVFSFVGYATLELPVGSATTLNATLTPGSRQLTEVVVTSFGIQRQAVSLGYSTTKVSGADINTAHPVDAINGLTGKVSGLQINTINAGLFAPTRVTLRGNRSLIGNNQPLIVVDGSIYYSDISTLNPEDIQSTDVLKGSSASAVYGSDASNGVIVITTKHGAKATSVTVSSTVDVETVSYMPGLQSQFGSNGGEKNVDNFNSLSYYIPYENQSYGPLFNGQMVPLGRPLPDGSVEMIPYSAVPNQKRDFMNTGITTHQNFSYDSGDQNGSFHMSAQDIKSSSVMPGDVGRRDIFRVGGDKKMGIFSATYSATYTYVTKNTTNTGSVYDDLLESPLQVPVSDLKNVNSKYGNPDTYYNDYYVSPGQIIAEQRNLDVENHINANLALNLKPWKWLNLTYRTSVENIQTRTQQTDAGISYSPFSMTNDTIYYSNSAGTGIVKAEDSGTKASAINRPPQYGVTNFNNLLYSSDFLASFNTKFAKNFSFNGTAGVTYLENKISNDPINEGTLNFLPYNTQNFSSTPSVTGQYNDEARKLGYFGEGTFGYKDYAFIHGAYRTDLDTRLSKANRYIPYYDIDGSVVLSEIFKGITNNDILNFAKLRYAHSLTGNVSALSNGSPYIAYGAYRTIPTLGASYSFPYASSGLSGYSLNTVIANPNIKPEKVTEDEVGLDLGFLNDRLNFTGSYYQSTTKDGIVFASVSSASGFTSALVNAANTSNKGLELDLNGTIIKHSDFTWNMAVNYTHQTSNVESIVSGVGALNVGNSAYAVVGHSYPQIEGYDWTRDPATGKVIVDPNTGLPTRASKLSVLGQSTPSDIFGLTTKLTYKSFTFSMTWDYRGGYKIYNSNLGTTLDHSGTSITSVVAGRQRFVFPNSVYKDPTTGKYVNNTNVEVQDGNFNFWPTLYQSVDANYVVSAAAWKLREALIAYNLPKQWINSIKYIKGATLSLSGRNLLMFRPKTNVFTDPEFNNDTGNGVGTASLNQLPPTRIVSTTLSVTF
ncbi:MAG: SusC/RagA family TonB-linked outer membrane protein [Mucilaginibacter sp.]|jgi:TonB-linked SusC/RagA family outer membrane protein|nr:SusC/RagA family TonB-linked outer membrane protein [Mucilaginibacter sp.]